MNELRDANIDLRTGLVERFTDIFILELETGCWGPLIISEGKAKRIYLTTCTKHDRPQEISLACMWAMSKFELTLAAR